MPTETNMAADQRTLAELQIEYPRSLKPARGKHFEAIARCGAKGAVTQHPDPLTEVDGRSCEVYRFNEITDALAALVRVENELPKLGFSKVDDKAYRLMLHVEKHVIP